MAKWRVGNPRTSPSRTLSRRVTRILRLSESNLRTRMRSPSSGQYSGLLHKLLSWMSVIFKKAFSSEASKRTNKTDGAIRPVTTAHSTGP